MTLVRSGVTIGLVIWAAATAVFVPLGKFILAPGARVPPSLSAALVVLATLAGIHLIARRVLRRDGAPSLERAALFGACACLPGLVLDGALYVVGGGRYPGLDAAANGTMTAALLLAYAAALLGALGAARRTASVPLAP